MKTNFNMQAVTFGFQKIAILILMATAIVGCEDFLEVDLPNSQLNSPFVFENATTANAAIVDIYAKIRDNGLISGNSFGLSASMGVYTDELDFYGPPTSSLNALYLNTVQPNTAIMEQWWNNSYNQIYAANLIIKGVESSETLNDAEKNQITGEALFIRALIHFYLVNTYGDIPYLKSTDYRANQRAVRLQVNEVYDNIIADLNNAKSLLPEAYFSGTRVRPNKSVAAALLSRVYLYNENWAEAANEASFIINQNTVYSFPADINNTFLIQSPSTIWQFLPQASGRNTLEGATFIFLSGPPSSIALRQELIESFEVNDLRKINWTKEITNANGTWYHSFKYKQRTITPSSQEHSIVFRLAEQYLIRAEARAKQGEVISAIEDLNTIRINAGLQNTTANTQDEIVEAILNERKVELFTENGHRFFDLKRTNQIDNTLSQIKPNWSAFKKKLPIPEREFLLNPNLLPQNEGY